MRADRQIKIRQFLFSRNLFATETRNRQIKIRQFRFSTIFAQSDKYNSRQYFRLRYYNYTRFVVTILTQPFDPTLIRAKFSRAKTSQRKPRLVCALIRRHAEGIITREVSGRVLRVSTALDLLSLHFTQIQCFLAARVLRSVLARCPIWSANLYALLLSSSHSSDR